MILDWNERVESMIPSGLRTYGDGEMLEMSMVISRSPTFPMVWGKLLKAAKRSKRTSIVMRPESAEMRNLLVLW